MIPVQLSLRNFLSYGDDTVTLDFSDFRVACLSGDNGHGKSALLDALTYALWGEGRKGRSERKADEGLLRLGTTEMAVGLTFDLDDDYSVICNTHTEMFADIMVVDAPYAVVADRDGGFTISDVIPGAYTATVVHGADRSEYEIDITAGLNDIDLTESWWWFGRGRGDKRLYRGENAPRGRGCRTLAR